MTDIVPALHEAIIKSFSDSVAKDKKIADFLEKVRSGKAKLAETHDYAELVGEHLSLSLQTNLVQSALPNGRMYFNIADRTVRPMLENNHALINDVAVEIQEYLDEMDGIGLKALRSDLPTDRIKGLIDMMCKEEDFEESSKWLIEPVVNTSESFFDDFVKKNAEFRTDAGMEATITRVTAPRCCDWCADLAGTYAYKNAPDDIYRRHKYCRCTVTFQSGRTRQDVWGKDTWTV